jgi:hypothetical protein
MVTGSPQKWPKKLINCLIKCVPNVKAIFFIICFFDIRALTCNALNAKALMITEPGDFFYGVDDVESRQIIIRTKRDWAGKYATNFGAQAFR